MRGLIGNLILLLAFPVSAENEATLSMKNGMTETLENYLVHNDCVVSICIFEQEWVPPEDPTKVPQRAYMKMSAVVTEVHRGDIEVGTQLRYSHPIEDPPRFKHFRSTVPGELRYFMFKRASATELEGKLFIGDHWGFDRLSGVFAEIFGAKLKKDPQLKQKANKAALPTPLPVGVSSDDS